jgi:asparagine synthase (glutamine-hydrolysing)
MTDSIAHRGPDDQGHWFDAQAGVALGHRRLSVVDLSSAGHQPMLSASGRCVLVFNGEIYNHYELRADIGDEVIWRGTSDTETLLAAIEKWGCEETLKRCVGMFALSVWDRDARTLTLARDRIGEKPLYYAMLGDEFVFGSQLRALRRCPAFPSEIDFGSLALFMQFGAVCGPKTIYAGVCSLPPGSMLEVRWNGRRESDLVPRRYWSLSDVLARPHFTGTAEDAVDELERLLLRSVRGQLMGDVPLGALLSGGIDSSGVAALMQKASSQRIKTYTVGFVTSSFNEAKYAAAVAEYLGTDHTELMVSERETLDTIPRLAEIWDEPFGDPSAIPTYQICREARRNVTVALSGDGGDELFGGYARYRSAAALERLPGKRALRRISGACISKWAHAVLLRLRNKRLARMVNSLRVLSEAVQGETVAARYIRYLTQPQTNGLVLRRVADVPQLGRFQDGRDLLDTVSSIDALTYLPDDVLCKVDRAAMSVSLETRVPLLDHRIVEFAFSLSSSIKIRHGMSKWPLRQVLNRHVPSRLTDRPKMGFGVPIDQWLSGELRPWAEDLLQTAKNDPLLSPERIGAVWRSYLAGSPAWTMLLWRLLMFTSWRVANR